MNIYPGVFLLESCGFGTDVLVLGPFWGSFWMWYETRVRLIFCLSLSDFPSIVCQRVYSSPFNCLHTLVDGQLSADVWVYLWAINHSSGLDVHPQANVTLSSLFSQWPLKQGNVRPSTLLFLKRLCLLFWAAGILIGIMLTLWVGLGGITILIILFFFPLTWIIFAFMYIFFHFFQWFL